VPQAAGGDRQLSGQEVEDGEVDELVYGLANDVIKVRSWPEWGACGGWWVWCILGVVCSLANAVITLRCWPTLAAGPSAAACPGPGLDLLPERTYQWPPTHPTLTQHPCTTDPAPTPILYQLDTASPCRRAGATPSSPGRHATSAPTTRSFWTAWCRRRTRGTCCLTTT
jgi:hypothetical protein